MRSKRLALLLSVFLLPACGDDDGTGNNNNNINTTGCGDDHIDPGEQCDDGSENSDTQPDACRTDCREAWCGDGVIDALELCDSDSLDNQTCVGLGLDGGTLACGDDCDFDLSGCSGCGNGVQEADEDCDGVAMGGATCSSVTGLQSGTLTCDTACVFVTDNCYTCGNGVIEGPETCDDGNINDGDGCSVVCEVEPGWLCTGEPSLCQTTCGDGVMVGPENCDDGGTTAGDGCDASCQVEAHYQCGGSPSQCECAVVVDLDPGITVRDGLTWATALASVQDGIDEAEIVSNNLGTPCDVWVAQGVYHIYETGTTNTVQLSAGVGMYGGFAGTETARDQRDVWANPTVLDGSDGTAASRVQHVVTPASNSILDGFVVTGGAGGVNGGGIVVTGQDPVVISNCIFASNAANSNGGGAYLEQSNVVIHGCVFMGNAANFGGGVFTESANVSITDSFIVGNSAASLGGGVHSQVTNLEVINSVFAGNVANQGGGVFVTDATVELTNCSIVSNGASTQGGGIYNHSSGILSVDSSILWDNQAPAGGAIFEAALAAVSYSAVQGGHAGTGNLTLDPDFVDPQLTGAWNTASFDFATQLITLTDTAASWTPGALVGHLIRLTSPTERWFVIVDNTATEIRIWGDLNGLLGNLTGASYALRDLHLSASSPCIDEGNDNAPLHRPHDMEGTPWADVLGLGDLNTETDMGAYEYTP